MNLLGDKVLFYRGNHVNMTSFEWVLVWYVLIKNKIWTHTGKTLKMKVEIGWYINKPRYTEIAVLFSFSSLWQNTWEKHLKGKKDLVLLTLSEVSVSDHLNPLFLGLLARNRHYESRTWQSKVVHLMATRMQRNNRRGRRQDTLMKDFPHDLFLQLGPTS
jgi:hypothetical protein